MRYISEARVEDRDKFVSQHYVGFPLPDGRVFVQTTGVVLINVKREHLEAEGDGWGHEDYGITVMLPAGIEPPEGKVFFVDQIAPFATLNGIENEGTARDAGWSINKFKGEVGEDKERADQASCWKHYSFHLVIYTLNPVKLPKNIFKIHLNHFYFIVRSTGV